MKKKLGSLLIVFTLIMSLALVGCGAEKKTETKATEKKEITVGFIYVGPVGDEGWTYSHDMGRKELVKQLGVKTMIKESVKEDLAEVEKVCEESPELTLPDKPIIEVDLKRCNDLQSQVCFF